MLGENHVPYELSTAWGLHGRLSLGLNEIRDCGPNKLDVSKKLYSHAKHQI